MNISRLPRSALVLGALLLIGIADFVYLTEFNVRTYPGFGDALRSGALAASGGSLPSWLPASASRIRRQRVQLGNKEWLVFDVPEYHLPMLLRLGTPIGLVEARESSTGYPWGLIGDWPDELTSVPVATTRSGFHVVRIDSTGECVATQELPPRAFVWKCPGAAG